MAIASIPIIPVIQPGCGWKQPKARLKVELFARYVQPGQSLSSLSTHLKQLKVPTPTGKKRWSNATLRRILTNPVYTGVIYAGRGRVQPVKRRR